MIGLRINGLVSLFDPGLKLTHTLIENHSAIQDSTNHWYLMTRKEKNTVKLLDQDYSSTVQQDPSLDANLIYDLGKDSATWTCSLMTPKFSNKRKRLLSRSSMKFIGPVDALASMGFPCTAESAEEMGTSIYPTLDHTRCETVAGRTTHLSVDSIVLLLTLVCFGKRQGH